LVIAISHAVNAEEVLYNPALTAADHLALQQLKAVGERWGVAGWILQIAAAATLACGIDTERVVRRIFVGLGVVIAADGLALLVTVLVLPLLGR
jgi:hypothetical protein